jgi:hypothetical protein
MTYWTVPREWTGSTAFVLGCGPSLKHFDADVLRGHGPVITINDSFMLAPWADVLYFTDEPWYRLREREIRKMFQGRYFVTLDNEQVQGVHHLKNSGEFGLETDPTMLRHGHNGGFAAINLAYHFGARRIVLLGIDMKISPKKELHWNNRPGWQYAPEKFQEIMTTWMLPMFDTLRQPLEEAEVEVINCNTDSALKIWPQIPLEEVLSLRHAERRVRPDSNREVVPL